MAKQIVLVDNVTKDEEVILDPQKPRSVAWYQNMLCTLADSKIGPYAWRLEKGEMPRIVAKDGSRNIVVKEVSDGQ